MRHIASLFAGLIIAPIAWLLIGAGTQGLDPNGLYQDIAGTPNTAIALAMFAGAGILLGLLAVTRMSPAGPLTVTVIFGAAFALYRFTSFHFSLPAGLQSLKIPGNAAQVAGDSGAVLVIGVLMLMAALVPSRWHGKLNEDDRVVDTADLAGNGSGFTKQPTASDAVEPFPPLGSEARMANTDALGNPPVGHDQYDTPTPAQPFSSLSPQAEERSPYADDGYGSENYENPQQQQQYR